MRALLLQLLYTVRSERMLMEQLAYNLLFRWFVGLSANEPVWHHTVFSKNRDRLLDGAVAEEFFTLIVQQARAKKLLFRIKEHFTVDGTLIEAWGRNKVSNGRRAKTTAQETTTGEATQQQSQQQPDRELAEGTAPQRYP